MTLSLLLASTLLAAPVPSFPAVDDCPNCGAELADDLDARIERVVRRVLAESGAKAPVARTAFGFSTLAEDAPKAHARALMITDDGEVHELDLDADNVVFGVAAPSAPDAPHPPHAIRVQKGDAPKVLFRSKNDVKAVGDDKKVERKIIVSSDGDAHEIHAGHAAPNVFRVHKRGDGKHEVEKEKKIEVRVDAGDGPKTFTRTIVVGPDGVVHDSHEGDHDVLHSFHANELHGIPEELEGVLHEIHVELEGIEGLKELAGLEALKGLEELEGLKVLHHLEGLEGLKAVEGLKALHHIEGLEGLGAELDVVLEMVDDEDGTPHVWHSDGGEMEFTFDVEVIDEGEGGAPHIIWTTDSDDAPAPKVEKRLLRRATRTDAAVDETEAQIEALNAEIEALERRLERLLKQAGNS